MRACDDDDTGTCNSTYVRVAADLIRLQCVHLVCSHVSSEPERREAATCPAIPSAMSFVSKIFV
jgi:hypothetical protein